MYYHFLYCNKTQYHIFAPFSVIILSIKTHFDHQNDILKRVFP